MYKGHIVEYAEADALFDNPVHPYTHLLLSAAPDSGMEEKRLPTKAEDEGALALRQGNGCRYGPRCSIHELGCDDGRQTLKEIGENHYVRCWKAAT
jgi:peptide/nickel transport system ATP-binding protein